MKASGARNATTLSEAQWNCISDLTETLRPFKEAQELLEGEKYVTISLVPDLICAIRIALKAQLNEASCTSYMKAVLEKLLESFAAEWGSGDPGTMYDEHTHTGRSNRHVGFRVSQMMAAFLDPRTKNLTCFDERDKYRIIDDVRKAAVKLRSSAGQQNKPTAVATTDTSLISSPAKRVCLRASMFGAQTSSVQHEISDVEMSVLEAVNTEIVRYQFEPKLEYVTGKDSQGKDVLGNPLEWWRNHETKFSTLAALARKLLCIPATSAPSERIFSHAGQTVSSLRSSLSPSNVSELVFLHDSWETIEKLTPSDK